MNSNHRMSTLQSDTEEILSRTTLLVVSSDFPDKNQRYLGSIFVKNQLDALKIFFKKIIVIAPVLFSGRIMANDRYCENYSYDNISVYYPRCFFIPRSVPVPLMKNSDKLFFDSRLSAVLKLIERESLRFDLIHAHFSWPSAYIAVRLKEKYYVPIVATIHEDSGWFQEEIRMNNPRLLDAWQNADALIRVNRADAPLLKKYNPHVYSIPNGFSPDFRPMDRQTCRQQLALPPDRRILLALGDLIPRKGFQYLIDAVGVVGGSRDDIICYIAGKGPYQNTLEKQIKRNNLEGKIRLAGFIPQIDLPLWINSADIFVLPSLEESFGIVQIEALACGIPVIAAKNVGSTEVIHSEDVGILCEPANSTSLAAAIIRGLDKKWDVEKIVTYSKQYEWNTIAHDLLCVYADLLKKREPGSMGMREG